MTRPTCPSYATLAGDGVSAILAPVGVSVCTGALIVAEAGLLEGYRATTHWAYQQRLTLYPGVEVVASRVMTDRNRITGVG